MIYNDRLTPPANWPPLTRYPRYYRGRRLSLLWFLALAILALLLSVIGLIIVFAVEHSWFNDSFENALTRYGLWRLCFADNVCSSWFTNTGASAQRIERRLNQSKAGINAWQALEIIFLFLTVATLVIAVIALICYRVRHGLHYYLTVLAAFCAWPAALVGIATLFVFGFAVYNVSTVPRDLDWCFYVNLVAVILALIAAILLSVYNFVLKRPIRNLESDAVIETMGDIDHLPTSLSPSTFVVVRRDKRKRNKPYEYPQVLYPHYSAPAATTTTKTVRTTNNMVNNSGINNDYVTTSNRQTLIPHTSVVTTHENNTVVQQPQQPLSSHRTFEYNRPDLVTSSSATSLGRHPLGSAQSQTYQPPIHSYRYQPSPVPDSNWHMTGVKTINRAPGYNAGLSNDFSQRGVYRPAPLNANERMFDQRPEPRLLHYYTGYDYFATMDPPETILGRPGSVVRYDTNTSYQPNDYMKSMM